MTNEVDALIVDMNIQVVIQYFSMIAANPSRLFEDQLNQWRYDQVAPWFLIYSPLAVHENRIEIFSSTICNFIWLNSWV